MNENVTTSHSWTLNAQFEDLVEYLIMRNHDEEQLEKLNQFFTDLSPEKPANPTFCLMRGTIDFLLGHKKEAEAWMEKALLLAPQSTEIIYIYAVMLMLQKKFAVGFASHDARCCSQAGSHQSLLPYRPCLKRNRQFKGRFDCIQHSTEN